MAVYGRQADVIANQGRGVNLYIPGKTQFNQGDVFLGGTGTGVTDEQLNGAQRVFGNTAEDTASAYGGFLKGSQSQARPQQQSQFRLPPGASPTLAMRAQMAGEDQANRNFDLQQKSFDWGKARDEAAQKLNVGQMMGVYDGQDTLQKQSFNAQNEQNKFSNDLNVGQLMGVYGGQDTLQKQAQLIAQANASRSGGSGGSSGGGSIKAISQSSPAGRTAMDDATIEIQNQLELGTKPGDIAYAIQQQGDMLSKQGINVASLLKSVWEMSGIQTKPEEEDSWR